MFLQVEAVRAVLLILAGAGCLLAGIFVVAAAQRGFGAVGLDPMLCSFILAAIFALGVFLIRRGRESIDQPAARPRR
jgi:hypothetical protein